VLHHTDYDTRLGAYAVVVDERERVLLALWNEADEPLWTLPGGGVELEETVEEGAVREVREETGYEVELGRLVGVDTIVVPPEDRTVERRRWFKGIRVVFEATVVGGDLRHEVDGTTDEARWIPLAEVPDLARVELVDVGLRLRAAAGDAERHGDVGPSTV
jgi:8-oxo-dGTP diphosphatase